MKKALRIITNKYFLTTVAFLLLFFFFDQNDWFTQSARKKELETTRNNIEFLNGEIARMEGELKALNTDTQKLEQYAREKYHEKRANEDVYLISIDTIKKQE
jgi:hypothetical protein